MKHILSVILLVVAAAFLAGATQSAYAGTHHPRHRHHHGHHAHAATHHRAVHHNT